MGWTIRMKAQNGHKSRVLLELFLLFAGASLLFQARRSLAPAGMGRPWLAYGLLLLLTPAFLLLSRRPLVGYGLHLHQWREQLRIAALSFFPILFLNLALSFFDWHQWPGALAVTAVEVALLVLLLWLFRQRAGAAVVVGAAGALFLPLPQTTAGTLLADLVYFYLFVGAGEELFFRGYIQSRLNQAFGRPYHILGLAWGPGLLLAALLFGFWHLAATSVPFGAWPGHWPQALWTVGAGLLLGVVRERSGGVLAPSLLHGVLNYSPLALVAGLLAG